MRLFSQRKGIKPVKSVMQVDYMDDDLRNRLWNALCVYYWDRVPKWESISRYEWLDLLTTKIWDMYLKQPIDTIGYQWYETLGKIRDYYFQCDWNEVYDLTEFVANNDDDESNSADFMDFCNSILEEELSAYRFVGGIILQTTSEAEIAEIEQALETPFTPVNEHMKSALDKLANRKSPDYRNSIKESISGVEALCKLITKNPKATLGEALDIIEREKKVKIHPALKRAFDSLYGYTSSADGIRHALLDEPNLYFEDAKFILVSCSGFVNYLVAKSSKAEIALGK